MKQTKRCSLCNTKKPISEFYKDKHSSDGHQYWCKVCRKEYNKRPKIHEKAPDFKVCTSCDISKPISEYSKHKLGKFGLQPQCRTCHSKDGMVYRNQVANSNKIVPDFKVCITCKIEKPIGEFHKNKYTLDGYKFSCSSCRSDKFKEDYYENHEKELERNRKKYNDNAEVHRERGRKNYQNNKELYLERNREYKKNNPKKTNARSAVQKAVKEGYLIRPDFCEDCGEKSNRIEGHHESYEEEHWLDVIWCCKSCHGKKHRIKFDEKQ